MIDGPVLSQIEWAYLAGIFDGEGYVGVIEIKPYTKNRKNVSPSFRITMTITNTNERLINWVHERIGGMLYVKTRASEIPKRMNCYRVQVVHGRALAILRGMAPYLIAKRDQVQLVFKLDGIRKGFDPRVTKMRPTALTEAQIQERRDIVAALKVAKKTQ